MKMKWYKFQIYLALWLGAITSVLTGLSLVSGQQYGDAQLVYGAFAGLQAVDIVYGVLCFAVAVLGVVARFYLADMRKAGIRWLLRMYVFDLAATLFYVIAAGGIVGVIVELLQEMAPNIIGAALGLVLNRVYYAKREHLFADG